MTGIGLLPIQSSASAKAGTQNYDIPAGPLRIALTTYARQSGRQVLFAPELVVGKSTQGMHGTCSTSEALRRLLANTGLQARSLHSGALVIIPAPRVSGTGPAPGRDIPSNMPGSVGNDIVITAMKYPTLLASSGMALGVIDADIQRERGLYSLDRIARAFPSLQQSENSSGAQRLTIRGVYGRGEPTVGVYFGDTPVSGPSGTTFDPGAMVPDLELVDIERIEVLRGPQGTLYGASSMGGTLRILFNPPDLSRRELVTRVGGDLIQDGRPGYNGSATINLPLLEDRLALRATGYVRNTGGYIDQPYFGLDNVGALERSGVRMGLAWQPRNDISLSLSGLHQYSRTNAAGFYGADSAGRRVNDLEVVTPNSNTLDFLSGTGQWMVDWGTFTAIASYYKWSVRKQSDFTNVIEALVEDGDSCQRYAGIEGEGTCTQDQFDQYQSFVRSRLPAILYQPAWVSSLSGELRFHSDALARTTLTIGLFAERRKDKVDSYVATASRSSGLLVEPVDITGLRSIWTELEQTALFSEASYSLTPSLTLTGGFRLFRYDKKAFGQVDTPNIITGTADIASGRFQIDETGINYKAKLTWRPSSRVTAYVQMADGFRPGGINITPSLTQEERTYHSDSLRSYEAGVHLEISRPAAGVDLALYHIDWSDMIFNASSTNNAFSYNTNIGAIVIDGGEGSLTLPVDRHWRLEASASWTDARVAANQERASTLGQLFAGDRVPMVPVLAGSAGLAWHMAYNDGTRLWSCLEVLVAGGFASRFNALQSQYVRTPGHAYLDAALGLERAGWSMTLDLQNVLNSHRPTQVLADSFGNRQFYGPRPRSAGLELTRRF